LLRLGVVLIAAVTTLTACAPPRQPLLAITLIGGWPVAILRTCTGGPAEINVTENSQAPTPSPGASDSPTPTTATPSPTVTPTTESYVYYWSIKTTAAPLVNEVPLFTTPTGWLQDGSTLKQLQPDARYIADASVDGVFDVSPVNFTVADLHKLSDGQVLYGINAPLTTVLTREEFDKKTAEACATASPSASPSAS
jgi:hypothetical protein